MKVTVMLNKRTLFLGLHNIPTTEVSDLRF